jgi:class 3 adenylate cyclase/tetratricopeptide (TPR) repeat protein
MVVCPRCGEENPERARFCLACGAPLTQASALPGVEERRTISVVFTDIVGSTASAEELDPEDVRARLAPYYSRVRHELESFGGTVEKFIGDAVVAIFGAPVAHEDDPERAVRAAIAVRNAIAELNAADEWLDLNLRTGVHTGEALVVLGARATEGEGMAAGDVMNTAARLQSAAPVNGIIVSEAAYRATAHAIEYREAEPVQAKGKSEPVLVWEVVRVRAPPSRRPVSSVPLIGRAAELERLESAWERTRAKRSPVRATVLGPPGIGKSRFLNEFAARVEDAADVCRGRCLPYGEGITYWPIIEILRATAGILHDDDAGAIAGKLGALLRRLPTRDADELRSIAAALSNLVGAATTPEGTYTTSEITQAELHWGIRRVLALIAATRPLVLIVEDLHWAEPTLLELLDSLAGAEAAPMLVVGSGRPELAELHPALALAGEDREVLELTALAEDESQALLAELLGVEQLPAGALATLLENAGGNPLFLEETVSMLADAGVLLDDGLVGDVAAVPVPTSLLALIGSRLDQLSPSEKRAAQHASVVGQTFWSGSLAVLDGSATELAGALEALERRELIRVHETTSIAGEREYSFKHALIRDVAYGQLPKGRRADLHLRFADWVERLPGSEDELVEIVAYHLEQACLAARAIARSPVAPPVGQAVDALSRAAAKSERREGYREAERFYARALAVVDEVEPELLAQTHLRHAGALAALGELNKAGEELAAVVDDARALGRADLGSAALIELGDIDQRQGRAHAGRERLLEARRLAAELGDRYAQVRAQFVLAGLHADFEGAFEEAVADLRHSVALAEEIDNRSLRAEGHLRIAALLINLGRFSEAEEELGLCLELAGEMGSHRVEAEATAWLSIAKRYGGNFVEAERLAIRAREWLERTCDSYFQVQNLVRLAMYALEDGDPRLAEERLREAVPIALEMRGWVVIEVYHFLVAALLRQGRLEDARRLAEFAGRSVSQEDLYARAALLLAKGLVAAAEGDEEAVSAFEEALDLLESLNMPVDVAEARVEFARALAQLGDAAAAREELERARALFASMAAPGALARLERELVGV